MATFICPACKSENVRFMTSLIVAAPMKYFYNLPKTALRSKDIVIWGAMWNMSDIYCMDCGRPVIVNDEDIVNEGRFAKALAQIADHEPVGSFAHTIATHALAEEK